MNLLIGSSRPSNPEDIPPQLTRHYREADDKVGHRGGRVLGNCQLGEHARDLLGDRRRLGQQVVHGVDEDRVLLVLQRAWRAHYDVDPEMLPWLPRDAPG